MKYRYTQRVGYALGATVGIILLLILFSPEYTYLHAKGVMNSGHEALQCQDCHTPAAGTFRQQLQANVKYLLGHRTQAVAFGNNPVTNKECVACHERPNDNHPVYRFNEPKYADVRKAIQPQLCTSCHQEHKGKRVTIKIDFCSHCHDALEIKHDPVIPTHAKIVHDKDWSSCLGCHDFHGNHLMKINKLYSNKIIPKIVTDYFAGNDSPYSNKKKYSAKQSKLAGSKI